MAQAAAASSEITPEVRREPDRNLALDLLRVTEAAAMAAGRWVGRRDKDGADAAAVAAMRAMMVTVAMDGVVVIGEGEKDDAPMLYNGERVGAGTGTQYDVAVDPVDGTTLTSKGMGNAVSVLAVASRGAMYDPSAVFYMDKLVADADAIGWSTSGNPRKTTSLPWPAPRSAHRRTSRFACSIDPGTTNWPTG